MAAKEQNLSNQQIILRRRNQALDRKGWISLGLKTILAAVLVWAALSQVFLITQARGNGMFPAVKDGDLVIAYRLQGEYVKKDLVVYTLDGEQRVGRVAAIGGDVVTLDDSGSLLVNGTLQEGEIVYPTYAKEALTYPYQVPEGHVFILGDYRTQAEDSRDFGPVPLNQVEAKIITILRRRGL